MISSAFLMGLLGVIALFLPQEILYNVEHAALGFSTLIIQIIGILYLGFAVINWMAKAVLTGGIYAKPLCMGNFFHFSISAITLIKATVNNPGFKFVWIAVVLYSIFTILFA